MRYLALLLAALTLSLAPAHAAKIPMQCSSVRGGQAGAAVQSFLADAPDALLRVCRQDTAAGLQTSYELRGQRRREQGICLFDAIALPDGVLKGTAGKLLGDLPSEHDVYMRQGSAACPVQDDPSYTRARTQYRLANADQFLWAMNAWGHVRAYPEDFAILSKPQFADPGLTVSAMLARNRSLPLRVVMMSAEQTSLRLLLHDARVTLLIEAPQDPAPQGASGYLLTLEPTIAGFDVLSASIIQ